MATKLKDYGTMTLTSKKYINALSKGKILNITQKPRKGV